MKCHLVSVWHIHNLLSVLLIQATVLRNTFLFILIMCTFSNRLWFSPLFVGFVRPRFACTLLSLILWLTETSRQPMCSLKMTSHLFSWILVSIVVINIIIWQDRERIMDYQSRKNTSLPMNVLPWISIYQLLRGLLLFVHICLHRCHFLIFIVCYFIYFSLISHLFMVFFIY